MLYLRRLMPRLDIEPLRDGARLRIRRGYRVEDSIRLGPNEVHAFITHADGSIEDLGISHNLLNTDGRDLVAAALGAAGINNGSNTASATSATSQTDSGAAWTTNAD